MISYLLQQSNTCKNCSLSSACLGSVDQTSLRPGVKSHRIYHKGDSLFVEGTVFNALFILRSGSAKSSISSTSGDEQITGFYHPGDLMGLDGFDRGTHVHRLNFLETSSVCCIGLGELDNAMGESANLRHKLLQSMSHALIEEHALLLSLGKMTSEQRLVKFLLDISARFEKRGLSGKEYILSMSRIDIANYLGMAIETISRLLTKMHTLGVIAVDHRKITLLDGEKLQACLAGESDMSAVVALSSKANRAPIRQSLSA